MDVVGQKSHISFTGIVLPCKGKSSKRYRSSNTTHSNNLFFCGFKVGNMVELMPQSPDNCESVAPTTVKFCITSYGCSDPLKEVESSGETLKLLHPSILFY